MSSPIVTYNAPPTISKMMMDDEHEVRLIMGPYGSGKTTGNVIELARRMMQENPDAQGVRKTRFVVVRNTAQQLRQSALEDIRKWLQPIMNFRVTDSTVQFRFNHQDYGKIESDWLLIPLDKPEDQQRLLSLNLTGGWVSEFREIPISIFEALLGRTGRYRALGVNKNAWHGIIAESNPPDEDSDWYKKMEIELPNNWAVYKQPGGMEPDAENRENLRDGYYESLVESNTTDWVDIHVNANYGKSLSGQAVFRASFRPEYHVTYEPLNPTPSLPLMIGQDFGRTPAALIGQIDSRGRLLIFQECVTKDMGIEQFVATVLRPKLYERFMGQSAFMIADPSGRYKGQITEESGFDALKRMGYKVYPAPTNDIDPRIRAVEQMLIRNSGNSPMVLIDGTNCPLLVQALKFHYRYKRKKNDQLEDSPEKTHPWSDLADCLQYMALGASGGYVSRLITPQIRNRSPVISPASWT